MSAQICGESNAHPIFVVLTLSRCNSDPSLRSGLRKKTVLSWCMATPGPALTLKDVLQRKPFRALWMAQFVSIFGDFLALFAVISLITYTWHGNPVQITLVVIAYALPLAVVGPPAGVFVDRWNVKRVMIAS